MYRTLDQRDACLQCFLGISSADFSPTIPVHANVDTWKNSLCLQARDQFDNIYSEFPFPVACIRIECPYPLILLTNQSQYITLTVKWMQLTIHSLCSRLSSLFLYSLLYGSDTICFGLIFDLSHIIWYVHDVLNFICVYYFSIFIVILKDNGKNQRITNFFLQIISRVFLVFIISLF